MSFPGTKLRRGRDAQSRLAGAGDFLLVLVFAAAGSSARNLPKRGTEFVSSIVDQVPVLVHYCVQ